jgi:hypothetical protein
MYSPKKYFQMHGGPGDTDHICAVWSLARCAMARGPVARSTRMRARWRARGWVLSMCVPVLSSRTGTVWLFAVHQRVHAVLRLPEGGVWESTFPGLYTQLIRARPPDACLAPLLKVRCCRSFKLRPYMARRSGMLQFLSPSVRTFTWNNVRWPSFAGGNASLAGRLHEDLLFI